MRTIFCLFLLISLEACFPTYIDRVSVKTTSVNTTSSQMVHIKNVYVLAKGNISMRVVSTNFYAAIEKLIKKNGSKSEFEFKRVSKDTQKVDIAETPNLYDGYMVLSSRDTALINFHQEKFIFATPTSSHTAMAGSGYGNAYADVLKIELFNSKKELIYTGEISLHFDPTKNSLYQKAADRFIRHLLQSNIQLW